eukprot:NODE_4769_length_335_cov_281.227273_g4160_i0.p1 GENE.NODE_4769_length_335_cov_281.227273_g4160_i0~~NODE_4769_length_335_cov_281.227273_g4160_i0.p1  ORF type:complete len:102 (+),score=36.25 NODE_4769_length_335_cov_281.227273_g4160_i0:30-308(+)
MGKIKRAGIQWKGQPARTHAKVYSEKGKLLGEVTSGCPSPVLKQSIAQCYVPKKWSKIGSVVLVEPREGGKKVQAEVVRMPFVPSNYYNPQK